MDTVIGFAVGYLVGTQQGRDGLRRVREAVDAIRSSEEVRRLVATGVSVVGGSVRQLASGGARPMVAGIFETAARKADELLGQHDEHRTS